MSENPNEQKPKRSMSRTQRQEFKSRAEQEAVTQRLLVLGLGIVSAVIAVLVVGSALWINVWVPSQAVANVRGQNISVNDFQKRVRFERYLALLRVNNGVQQAQMFGQSPEQAIQQEPLATWWNELNNTSAMGQRVLNDMTDELLLAQLAAERGITITDAQIDEATNEFFGYTPLPEDVVTAEGTAEVTLGGPTATPSPTLTRTPFVSATPSPTPTTTFTPSPTFTLTPNPTIETPTSTPPPVNTLVPFATPEPSATPSNAEQNAEFRDNIETFYTNLTTATGWTRDDIRSYFRTQATRIALRESVASFPSSTTYSQVRHILVATQEQARDVLTALQNGEAFTDLARALSTDTGSAQRGGDLGFAAEAQYLTSYVDEFAKAVRGAAIGEIVGPVQSQFGFHIIQVTAREQRAVAEEEITQAQSRAFEVFLTEQKDANAAQIQTFSNIWSAVVPIEPNFDDLSL
jgi:hypothetical protein